MKTATGFEVENPRELLRGFVRSWYPMYDGVEVAQDNQLRVIEIALSTMINSRMSGNTGGAIWTNARAVVEEALADIRPGIDLLDVPASGPIPGEKAISRAVTEMCNVPWTKLSIATKILHKKRPGLIPIFDSVVESQYKPHCPTVRGRSYGDYAIALIRLVHKDLLSVADELRDLRIFLEENKTPLSSCRILNVLMWSKGSDNEARLRRLAVH